MTPLTSLRKAEALRYLGYAADAVPDSATAALLEECERTLLAVIEPRYLFRVFPLEMTETGFALQGCVLPLEGEDILTHLEECTHAVLLAATLSTTVDTLLRTAQVTDMARAVVLDALASTAVEQVCESAELEIRDAFPQSHQTWRYSPGYGDFPITVQGTFLDVLDAPKRIGLCASDSSMLIPSKSVTAIIGLSDNELPKRLRGCTTCRLRESCQLKGSCAAQNMTI